MFFRVYVMLNRMPMKITIKASVNTNAFDNIRNKKKLEEVLRLELAYILKIKRTIAEKGIKITIKEDIE